MTKDEDMKDLAPNNWSQRVDRLMSGTIQEQIRTAAGDVRNGLDELAAKFQENLESFGDSVAGSSYDSTRRLAELLFSVGSTVSELRNEVDSLRVGLADAVAVMRENIAAVAELRSLFEGHALATSQRMEALESRVGSLEAAALRPAFSSGLRLAIETEERQSGGIPA